MLTLGELEHYFKAIGLRLGPSIQINRINRLVYFNVATVFDFQQLRENKNADAASLSFQFY